MAGDFLLDTSIVFLDICESTHARPRATTIEAFQSEVPEGGL
jgi:hypothetical protein